ncbi:MAG: hypothetical protein WA117_21930 [Verrucomicrobiia bacterium]
MADNKSNEHLLDELQKAAHTVQNITDNGGVLLAEQAEKFVIMAQEQQIILPDARVEIVARGQKELDTLGMDDVFLQPGTEDNTTLYTDPATYLGDEAKATTSKISLAPVYLEGRTAISREALRRNIERENFADTLIQVISSRAGYDMELLGVRGDTALPATTKENKLLRLKMGYLKRVPSANKVYWGGESFNPNVFAHVINKVAAKYRRRMTECRLYVSHGIALAYQLWLSKNKATPAGDQAMVAGSVGSYMGVPVVGCDSLPDTTVGSAVYGKILFTKPKNLIWAIEDQIEIEDEIIKARNTMVIYFRAYVDPTVEVAAAMASCEDVAFEIEGS